nr:hypothetical protein [Tanacetum cinerariifolium]
MSLMRQWHDTICGGVIGSWRSLLERMDASYVLCSVQFSSAAFSFPAWKLTNVKRQVASLKSKVEGLEQKIDTLKNDLNDTKSQRDADLENLSSCPLSPPVYKWIVSCHLEISVLQETRKLLTQKGFLNLNIEWDPIALKDDIVKATTCCRRRRVSPKKPSDAVELLVLPEKNMGFYKIPVIFLDLLSARDFTIVAAAVAWATSPLPPPPLPSSPQPQPQPQPQHGYVSPPPPNLLLCNLKFVGNL